jgi:hypothetical protein
VYWERFAGATGVAVIEEMSRAAEPGGVSHAVPAATHEIVTQSGRSRHPDLERDRQPRNDAARE